MPPRGHPIALTFLNSSSFEDIKSKKNRTKVRSHISKLQHARTRNDLASQRHDSCTVPERHSGLHDDEVENDASLSKSCIGGHDVALHAGGATSIPHRSIESANASASLPTRTSHHGHDRMQALDAKQRRVTWHDEPQDANKPLTVLELQMRHQEHVECFNTTAKTSAADIALTGPGSFAPVHYKPWYGWLMDYWYQKTLPESRKLLKATSEDIEHYTMFSRRQEHVEPALYYMSLLLASGIPTANDKFPLVRSLWLRGETVRTINEALSDPSRAISTPLILAVGQIALHEHIYGDREAAHRLHRTVQHQMIAMRGGFHCLNLPPIVMRVIIWYDRLMAAEAGTPTMFPDLTELYSLEGFTDEEAMEVTNFSSPRRHHHPGYGPPMRQLDESLEREPILTASQGKH